MCTCPVTKWYNWTLIVFVGGGGCSTGEPENLKEALGDSRWKKAMDEEYAALMENKTWHLVPLMKGSNIIDCKWVYKAKRKSDGAIARYKARLVAKGLKRDMVLIMRTHLLQ